MNLQLGDFSGPFDLLLHLVRVSEMDIYSVNISSIIEQYLEFINSIDKNDIDQSSEYLVMASELIHLKSKMLVNKNDDELINDEEEYEINSEEDLRNKLVEYEKYKYMTEAFKSLEENRQDYYTKIPENLKEYTDNEYIINSDVTVDDLINAFLDLKKRMEMKKPTTTKISRKEYSVKTRINEIRNILKSRKKVEFTELFEDVSKGSVVVTLLSILDMSKNNEILLYQEHNFSKIMIESK